MTSISNSFGSSRPTPVLSAAPLATARRYVQDRRGLYALTFVLVTAGLAFGSAWWGFAAILPLLYVLPCAAMMAMCMNGHGGPGQNLGAKPNPTPKLVGGPATSEAGPR